MGHLALLAVLLWLGAAPNLPEAVTACLMLAWLRFTPDAPAPLLPSRLATPNRRTRVGKQFTTEKRQPETIVFSIDEDEFHFTPPKMATAMLPILDPKSRRNGSRPAPSDNGDATAQGEDPEEREARDDQTMTQAAWQWLYDGLPDDEWERLRGRLRDPDDGLDVTDVVPVVRWLLGQTAGRPTTSRRG